MLVLVLANGEREHEHEDEDDRRVDDPVFLFLAKRAGAPLEPQLRRCAELQAEARKTGEPATLFEVARRAGIVSDEQAIQFLEWERTLTPSKRVAAARPPSPSKRVEAAKPATSKRVPAAKPRPRVKEVFKSSAVRIVARVRREPLPEETLSPAEQRLRTALGVLSLGALVVLLGLGGVIAMRRPPSATVAPPPVPSPPPPPVEGTAVVDSTPAPVVTAEPTVAPVLSAETAALESSCDLSRITARVALDLARDLVRQGREPDAVDRLDEALAGLTDAALRKPLVAERQSILSALLARMQLDFALAEQAARSGDTARTKEILDALYPHVPNALAGKRRQLYDRLVVVLDAPATAARKADPAPATASPTPRQQALERVLGARAKIDDALLALDVAAANALVVTDVTEKDLVLEARNDAARIEAVSQLVGFVREAFEWDQKNAREVGLEQKKGGTLRAAIKKVLADRLVVRVPFKGDREVKLVELTVPFLCDTARRGAGEAKAQDYSFGAGVLLACAGELDAAVVELARSHTPQASLLRVRIDKELALRPPVAKDDKKPTNFADRQKRLEELRVEGRWRVARACRHYDILSNGPEDEVRELALAMDLMCDEYVRVFAPAKDPPVFSIRLYRDRAEFLRESGTDPKLLGFFDGDRIVSYHQEAVEKTRTTLFHEGAHQFEALVWGKNIWTAPIWFVEGLAVYFEASQVQGARLLTDQVSRTHLLAVQRAIKAQNAVPLATLIRMKQPDFGFTHYAHAWSFIYFLVHGTSGGLERIRKYFAGMRDGKDGGKLFEELFDRPMSEIDDAWKNYVKAQK